jgi:hypothetical protein
MGFLSDIVSNPGKALGSDLTGGNSLVGQAGQAVGICGRQAMANPIVDALAGAALAYFDPFAMVSGLGGLTGLGMAANAGLITGGLAGLSTGNLTTGLKAGLAGWTGAGLEQMALGPTTTPAPVRDAVSATPVSTTSPTTSVNVTPNVSATTTTPLQSSSPVNYSLSGSSPGLAYSTNPLTPSPYSLTANAPIGSSIPNYSLPASVYTPAAPQTMFGAAKCFVTSSYAAHPVATTVAGIGAVDLAAQGIKKAATPNTVSAPQSPASNVIRQYSYNPYTGQYTAGPVINAANFGSQPVVPVHYCKCNSTYSAATGGIVALANGGAIKARQQLMNQSRGDETELLHVTPSELYGLNAIKQRMTGTPLPRNPNTGLHEAGFFQDVFSLNPATSFCKAFGSDLTGGNSLVAAIGGSGGSNPSQTSTQTPSGPTQSPTGATCSSVLAGALNPLKGICNLSTCVLKQFSIAQINALSPCLARTLTPAQIAAFNPTQLAAYDAKLGIGNVTTGGQTGAVTTPTTPSTTPTVPAAPVIPIPPGGNRNSLNSLLSMYEMGGGSVGSPIINPVSQDQFNQEYNTMSGDSANAYNFLMGKTTQPKITGHRFNNQVAVPYASYIQNPSAYASGGIAGLSHGGQEIGHLGGYSDGGRLLRGPGDGVSDSIPATIGAHDPEPARLADGEFVVPARIVSELGNGSTEAGARKLYQMMDRIQKNRARSVGHNKVAVNSHSDKFLPA